MPYIPHTDADRREMLSKIGVSSIEELFAEIPAELRLSGQLNIPESLDEHALFVELSRIAGQNGSLDRVVSFLGAGIYEHYIPSIVMELVSRGEFLSAYTPYQPEVSQGYLQTIYEFQSMICEITGMDVANASMYDGATALAEAAIMCAGLTNRKRLLMSTAVHPHYRQCVKTFAEPADCDVVEPAPEEEGIGARRSHGQDGILELIDGDTACVVFQYPDFFGRIVDPRPLMEAAHAKGAMAVAVCDPVALGVLVPPGSFGADVMVGEAQPLGVPMGFGGPLVGYFCVKREYIRAIPGRIVGRTHDADGRRGFVMTLRTREQDIRREKATSNICTNQALMALATTVWMAALGKNGFTRLAETCVQKAHYAAEQLTKIPGVSMRFAREQFAYEFTLDVGQDATAVRDRLLKRHILAGLPLGEYCKDLTTCLLVCVTETRTKGQIDEFATELAKVVN